MKGDTTIMQDEGYLNENEFLFKMKEVFCLIYYDSKNIFYRLYIELQQKLNICESCLFIIAASKCTKIVF